MFNLLCLLTILISAHAATDSKANFVVYDWNGEVCLADDGSKRIGINQNLIHECSNLRKKKFIGVDLTQRKLNGSLMDFIRLSSSNLTDAGLAGCSMQEGFATRTIFMRANLEKSNLRGMTATQANFENANVQNADLSAIKCSQCNFQKAQLQNSKLKSAFLIRSNFSGANLSGSDFSGAVVVGAKFERAIFSDKTVLPWPVEVALQKGMVKQ